MSTDTRRDVAERQRRGQALHDTVTGCPDIWYELDDEDRESWCSDADRYHRMLRSERREPDAWIQYSDLHAWQNGTRTLVHMAETEHFEGQLMTPVYFGTPSDSPTGDWWKCPACGCEVRAAFNRCPDCNAGRRAPHDDGEPLRPSDSPERCDCGHDMEVQHVCEQCGRRVAARGTE